MFAAYLAFLNGGAMLGPLIGGWLALRFGYPAAFVAMAGSMVAAMLILRSAPPVPRTVAPAIGSPGTEWRRVLPAIAAVTLCFAPMNN